MAQVGITDLASRLSRGEIEHMPTCAIAHFVWAGTEAASTDTTDAHQPNPALPAEWHFDPPGDAAAARHPRDPPRAARYGRTDLPARRGQCCRSRSSGPTCQRLVPGLELGGVRRLGRVLLLERPGGWDEVLGRLGRELTALG